MRLTKLGHSCVRLEKDGVALVIDPGVWSDAAEALSGAKAVLVTHEHADHLDPDAVRSALGSDGGLELWAPGAVAAQFAEHGGRVHAVAHGDTFTAAGFGVRVFGHDHAVIHPDMPHIANTGFAVDGEVFHPGDALTVPDIPVPTLLLPATAPWLKAWEMIDYFRKVAPQRGYVIHDGIANAHGLALLEGLIKFAAKPSGAPFTRLEPGTSLDL
jgi:L-ascorbate metabolism protein UlaG (beta-lactamase superfamily)